MTSQRGRSLRGWFWRLLGYLAGSVGCLVIHALALFVLVSLSVGTPLWLAGGVYVVILVGLLAVRPHWVTIMYGLAGGLALALVQSAPQSVPEVGSPLALVAGIYWGPAVLAGLWWAWRR